MIFETTITIPKSTTQSNPKEVILVINKGVITKFMVRPRIGSLDQAHIVIKYHEGIIAPSTENMSLHGNADPIDWEDHIEVLQPPFELKIQGWNDSIAFEHIFTVFVVVLPKSVLLVHAIVDAITSLIRAIFPVRRILGGGP